MRLCCAILALAIAGSVSAAEPLLRFDLPGRTVEGTPLAWSEKEIYLLARDGQLIEFPPEEAKNPSKLTGGFKSLSQGEIRGLLLAEFGQGYEVSGVGHYLVVHATGQRDQWAPRFEELYRS